MPDSDSTSSRRESGSRSDSNGADSAQDASPSSEGDASGDGATDATLADSIPQALREPISGDGMNDQPDSESEGDAESDGNSSAEKPAVQPRKKSPLADFDPLAPYRGAVRRFFTVYRHVAGLLMGGHIAYVRSLPDRQKKRLRSPGKRFLAFLLKPFVKRDLRNQPFPVQLRKRLEILGPTFTKLGQIMAIREDLLPDVITRELESLMDHLPAIPFEQVKAIIERDLQKDVEQLFFSIDPEPLGSASIAQAHRAVTRGGDEVVVKVIKPGIRDVITSDLKLLEFFGVFLQWIIPRYQPVQIIEEFSAYTRREVDYTYEADNAEVFAANFQDMPGIVFPDIYRELSSDDVLTMEFLEGIRPGSPESLQLSEEERHRVIDLGAASIIRMLYDDGFFHADLHAGNLKIIPGSRPKDLKLGFIDLGMVGRFNPKLKRRMLYYYYALVRGDVENAARHLLGMARIGEDGDPQGFRRAVSDMARHFLMRSQQGEISFAQVILQSLSLGGRYHVFFPVEMTLMVKALVTFEGVGRTLDPDLDVVGVSRRHVQEIFRDRFDPRALGRELVSNAPEVVDIMLQLPQLMSQGVSYAEEKMNTRRSANDQISGLRSGIIAGSCIMGGVVAVVQGGPLWLSIPLFVIGGTLALFAR